MFELIVIIIALLLGIVAPFVLIFADFFQDSDAVLLVPIWVILIMGGLAFWLSSRS